MRRQIKYAAMSWSLEEADWHKEKADVKNGERDQLSGAVPL